MRKRPWCLFRMSVARDCQHSPGAYFVGNVPAGVVTPRATEMALLTGATAVDHGRESSRIRSAELSRGATASKVRIHGDGRSCWNAAGVVCDRDNSRGTRDLDARHVFAGSANAAGLQIPTIRSGIQIGKRWRSPRDLVLRITPDRRPFRDLCTIRVVLVSRQSHRRRNADDRNDDHQLDEGETLLDMTLHEEFTRDTVGKTFCRRRARATVEKSKSVKCVRPAETNRRQ